MGYFRHFISAIAENPIFLLTTLPDKSVISPEVQGRKSCLRDKPLRILLI
jgi:hypothetical protein